VGGERPTNPEEHAVNLPTVTFDSDKAREWLRAPEGEMTRDSDLDWDEDTETNLNDCGIFVGENGEPVWNYQSDNYLRAVKRLVEKAEEAGLFGPEHVAVRAHVTADGEGYPDGILVTVDVRHPRGPVLPLAGTDSDYALSPGDENIRGLDAALAVLENAADEANNILNTAREALTLPVRKGAAA
jgi:hypothetical protein